ncbi:hypothetical protein Patl1_15519 [Pistacia atlantica]|uniref:Uncharacterized protein n=1 Tax=Pistacia atlantica TaxID=434234 RepID=A0ACC1B6E6_9ROSI|nr:hypothetical protein Patl1_15519 [Pistacia atlantica]
MFLAPDANVLVGANLGRVFYLIMSSIGHFLVAEFGSLAYYFTKDRIKELRDEEEAQKKNQTLRTILVTPSRDFVISNDGKEGPIQPGCIECGFYIIRYMKDIAENGLTLLKNNVKIYEDVEVDEVGAEWAIFSSWFAIAYLRSRPDLLQALGQVNFSGTSRFHSSPSSYHHSLKCFFLAVAGLLPTTLHSSTSSLQRELFNHHHRHLKACFLLAIADRPD